MRRKKLTPLIFIVLVAAVSLGAVLVTDTSPQLGLDLQGGVSVVLQPTEEASDEALSQTIEIIRSRVDALGVAEPEITRQGDSVVVQLPGVKNQQRASSWSGDTAELRFRPVLQSILGDHRRRSSTAADDHDDRRRRRRRPRPPPTASTTTTARRRPPRTAGETATPTTAVPGPESTTTTGRGRCRPPPRVARRADADFELTPREEDLPEATVILAEQDDDGEAAATYQLGPVAGHGHDREDGRAPS